MSNANRDYAIVYDVKNGFLVLSRPLIFYITDKNTSNIFVKLVTRVNVGNGMDQYTDIENASNYVLTMRVIKPNNEVKSFKATQHEEGSIFQFDLTEDFKDIPGKYICELTISTIVNSRQELITSEPFSYEVKRSILSNIGEIIETENTTVEKLLNDLEATKAEISSQIKEKPNKDDVFLKKNAINLNDLDEESRKAILEAQGMNVNYVLGEKNVTPANTTFFKIGKNRFDKSTVINDKYLDSTGGLFDIEGYSTSDFIYIKDLSDISVCSHDKICLYDTNKNYISTVASPILNNTACYLRLSCRSANLNNVQVEEGSNNTTYESYTGYTLDFSKISSSSLEEIFLKKPVDPKNIIGYKRVSKNLFDKASVYPDKYLNNTGQLFDLSGYYTSDFIEVEQNTIYVANGIEKLCYYNENKVFIKTETGISTFTNSDAKYIRFCNRNTVSIDTFQLEKGNISTAYEKYDNFIIENLSIESDNYERKCSFADAWACWSNNEKFPIGILGDSTVDGANTTGWTYDNGHENMDNLAGGWGKHDYINTNAYPYKLQELIRQTLNNDKMRVYNIGYSGTQFAWAIPKYDEIFGYVYSDVKMVGIVYGINDRMNYTTFKDFYKGYKRDLIYTIKYLYDKGIQPFLITTQSTIEPYILSSKIGSSPLRTTEYINSVANRIKHEVAKEFDLELIDLNKFTEHILNYSEYDISKICPDHLHFSDLGHTLEANFIFSNFSPNVIDVEDNSILSFANQQHKSFVSDDKISYLNQSIDKFRIIANYTKENTDNMLIQDFWINNISKSKLNLKSYCSEVLTQYVLVDGVEKVISNTEEIIGSLDIGVHHVQVYTGQNDKVNWLGFKLMTI